MSTVKVAELQDVSGNTAIDVAKVAGNASRYVRQSYVQNDLNNYSFSTSWVLGPSFSNVSGFKEGSLIEVTYYIPCRNDSTSWGGIYIEPQFTFDNSTWLRSGTSGYTAVMELGNGSISFYGKTLLIDPSLESVVGDFQFNIRFYCKSYDGTTTINQNNDVGNAGSGVCALATGANRYQHYASIVVKELALLRGNS